ncbi:pyrroline-5-carboxylate reductase [Fructilactobacillus vespulae]|uniref:pyrroline-5-carboxylate reductase family protein n=1 Tax=Fructilactobacillus vespulae TaxID=1249630 RepID=UPI0039B42805
MKIGILGAGHMGSAMIRGLANQYPATNLLVKGNRIKQELLDLQQAIGFQLLDKNDFKDVDLLIVATPAPITLKILPTVQVGEKTVIVSAVQGVSEAELKQVFPNNSVICMIPNIPVEVNAGCIAVASGTETTEADFKMALKVLQTMGETIVVKPENLNIVGTVAGCGPAFVDVFLSALSDAAVQNGLDRKTSYEIAAAMVAGSAQMALQTGENPAELKDQVTSPGGSTIKGVVALDQNGFRNAINQAVNRANGTD